MNKKSSLFLTITLTSLSLIFGAAEGITESTLEAKNSKEDQFMDDKTTIQLIETYLQQLCENIGARPVGSESNQKAQSYIGGVFQENGWDVEYQSFDCMDWQETNIDCRVGDKHINAVIAPYSLPCDVKADYVLLGNVKQLADADLKGKIAVLNDDLTKEALMPKNFKFWNPEEHQQIIRLLEEKNPLAVITISFNEDIPTPIIEDGDFMIPCAVTSKKEGQVLVKNVDSVLTLKIISERKPSKGANVIARINNGNHKKKMLVSAHFDTKPGTPGALDNASGTAILLALSKLLKDNKWSGTIELVAFNGEDYYSNAGEIAYLEKYGNTFNNILLAANCDGVGLKDGKNGISYMECPPHYLEIFEKEVKNYSTIEVIDPWYQGDHMMFVSQKVPTITLTSSKIFQLIDTVIHTDKDTLELIDPKSILDVAKLLVGIIRDLDQNGN